MFRKSKVDAAVKAIDELLVLRQKYIDEVAKIDKYLEQHNVKVAHEPNKVARSKPRTSTPSSPPSGINPETKRKIINAANKLRTEHDKHEFTVDDIAYASGYAPSTIRGIMPGLVKVGRMKIVARSGRTHIYSLVPVTQFENVDKRPDIR